MTSDSRLKREAMRPRSGLSPEGESGGAGTAIAHPKALILTYESGNKCPGCRKVSWDVRNSTAECCYCNFVMMIDGAITSPSSIGYGEGVRG